MGARLRAAQGHELDAATLYALLQLRAAVFVVEQRCAYTDLDGLDLLTTTRHLWLERDSSVVAGLRLLAEPGGGTRIGRVVTTPAARGQGLATRLVLAALAEAQDPVCLSAQAQLAGWYERLGFVASGPRFEEDGILHLPMRHRGAPP